MYFVAHTPRGDARSKCLWHINGRMQSYLHESILTTGERGLEWSSCETPILTPMRLKDKNKWLFMMHKMDYYDIQILHLKRH